MTINYYRKNVYGKENLYIAEPSDAKNIGLLLNKKTISKIDIGLFKTLGIEFTEVFAPTI